MTPVAKRRDTEIREVDTGGQFHRGIMESTHSFTRTGICKGCGAHRGTEEAAHRCPDADLMPYVRVVIQIRHDVPSIAAYRAKLAKLFRGFRKRGVPKDERPEILEQAMNDGDSREWTDVETYWDGRYDPRDVKLPVREELEAIEQAYGAAEARVRVRAGI